MDSTKSINLMYQIVVLLIISLIVDYCAAQYGGGDNPGYGGAGYGGGFGGYGGGNYGGGYGGGYPGGYGPGFGNGYNRYGMNSYGRSQWNNYRGMRRFGMYGGGNGNW